MPTPQNANQSQSSTGILSALSATRPNYKTLVKVSFGALQTFVSNTCWLASSVDLSTDNDNPEVEKYLGFTLPALIFGCTASLLISSGSIYMDYVSMILNQDPSHPATAEPNPPPLPKKQKVLLALNFLCNIGDNAALPNMILNRFNFSSRLAKISGLFSSTSFGSVFAWVDLTNSAKNLCHRYNALLKNAPKPSADGNYHALNEVAVELPGQEVGFTNRR